EYAGKVQTRVFQPEKPTQQFPLLAPSRGRQFLDFNREGVRHIWTGLDHILFLLALLLPSVLKREAPGWRVVERFRPALINVLKIVTAFTIAHSITLSLATLGIVRVSSRLVEPAIAASVILAALNNIRPILAERGWVVAFGFGLVHGFGFANVLAELGLARQTLALALVGFNLGVELGQLAIVAAFLPLAFGLRGSWIYQRLTFQAGSAIIALLAATWMMERILNLKWLPF
ncbi:MAG TPA: HupE/UreJ family protein, partial [Haliangiales bacterium]|nr:HupE/UreJ family protein [Haliangiales bacterium]